MNGIVFKEVAEQDLTTVLEIYNHYILTTTATFRLETISMETLKSFIYLDHPRYRTFLILRQGEVAGFCFLTQYKNLPAYDRTAEMGIYIKPGFTHQGLGSAAVNHLEKKAEENGFKVIIASISGENTPSINLFKKSGYDECGHFKKVGEKFGRVLDVVYFQKVLENNDG